MSDDDAYIEMSGQRSFHGQGIAEDLVGSDEKKLSRMVNEEIERAVRIAAVGNVETFNMGDHDGAVQLDAESFIKDLRASGWDIVRVRSER